MYKGKEIIGKPVVSYDVGEKFYTIQDLLFDQTSNQILGFLVQESSWFNSAHVLLLKDVQSIGPDAVITASKNVIVRASEIPVISHILERNNILQGTRILTMDGRDLGIMIDLYFDEKTGEVEGYEVSGGLFADAYSGRSFVPAPQTLKIGKDVAFVPTETAQLMKEQVGGIKAAMQTANERVQETAQVTGDKIQEFGRIASEKAHETAQLTGVKIQELGQSSTTSVTNTIVDPEEQKAFVIGKTVKHSVSATGGQYLVLQGEPITPSIADLASHLGLLDELYRATGGSVLTKIRERVDNSVAGLTIEQAYGRRIQSILRSDEGAIIAAPGQIVTEQVIKRAKIYHKEQALLQAVGLSTGEAMQHRTSNAMTVAGNRFKSTTQDTGAQLQVEAKYLWAHVKEAASEIQGRGTQAIEEQRIKGALGRAVTRVILDEQDDVILNVGELITHQAIDSARQSHVLDLLLSSVYHETPKLSLDDLRAPHAGKAAL
jgi:uncharacterized protein YrrD